MAAPSVGNAPGIGEPVLTPDAVCAAAVDLARAAAQAVAGHQLVGDHVGVEADAERIVTHFFACTDRAYTDWRWAVTVVRAPRSKTVTVDEVVLLPGPGALLAPAWVPWSERLQAGDLGVGDVLPTAADDERLVPGYAASARMTRPTTSTRSMPSSTSCGSAARGCCRRSAGSKLPSAGTTAIAGLRLRSRGLPICTARAADSWC